MSIAEDVTVEATLVLSGFDELTGALIVAVVLADKQPVAVLAAANVGRTIEIAAGREHLITAMLREVMYNQPAQLLDSDADNKMVDADLALQALGGVPPALRLPLVSPLLTDPLRAIRLEAASLVASAPPEQLRGDERAAFEHASREFIQSQHYNGDRVEARVNLGTFYASRGDMMRAEEELTAAIAIEPDRPVFADALLDKPLSQC